METTRNERHEYRLVEVSSRRRTTARLPLVFAGFVMALSSKRTTPTSLSARWHGSASVFAILIAALPAAADVTISSDATQNMNCANGVCAPTSSDAVLNVSDLESLLAAGNVTVTTTGSGVQANNIDVTASLLWTKATLTFDAYGSLSVSAPILVKARSGLSILTNHGGSGGELAFFGKGHVSFKNLASNLSINGARYTLVNSIKLLAGDIAANPSGSFALAADYDARQDGTYSSSPIGTGFAGIFEGMGNKITNLALQIAIGSVGVGFFSTIGQQGQVRDISLSNVTVQVEKQQKRVALLEGTLAGDSAGNISRAFVTGTVTTPTYQDGTEAGGLVGTNSGQIEQSSADVLVEAPAKRSGDAIELGGLVGVNGGQIGQSYSTGRIDSGDIRVDAPVGSLAGSSNGSIVNCYATGKSTSQFDAGGLIGENDGNVSSSYSTGVVSGANLTGGLIGVDYSSQGSLSDTYWDTDTSGVTNLSQGAGSPPNDPGITGLSTGQLQAGLPTGFDSSIWGENANVNNGLPYLLAIPPDK
jgi:hypothetical protein